MKKKLTYGIALVLILCLALFTAAYAFNPIPAGTVLSFPSPLGLTVIFPEDMKPVDMGEGFPSGFGNSAMFVGVTAIRASDIERYKEERGLKYADNLNEVTVNGFNALKYTFTDDETPITYYAIQENPAGYILELMFLPLDPSASAANEACIAQVMESIRGRTQTYEAEQDGSRWTMLFQHADSGLQLILPSSMVRNANQEIENSAAEMQNDYITLTVFAYQATMDEYIAGFEMTTDRFNVTDTDVNGVAIHVFEPKSGNNDSDYAYAVAEGKDGVLLELAFYAVNPSDEENWNYISRIISTISAM